MSDIAKKMKFRDPPSINWVAAKELLFPRVEKALRAKYANSDFEVVDIVGDGYPDPDKVLILDMTSGWGVYYNNIMKLHPIVKLNVGGEKKRIKIPGIINAVLTYDERKKEWGCTAFEILDLKN
ncbi:MAG: hypothetical protein ABII22_03045 [Candidatus Micrarchaeota archaeon]